MNKKDILQWKKKKITLEELEKFYDVSDYKELVEIVKKELERNRLKPIQNAKTNGKNPTLFLSYWVIKGEEESKGQEGTEELKFSLDLRLHMNYYLHHLDIYEQDKSYIQKLNQFLKDQPEQLDIPVSLNERSFQIWGREKFLKRESGMRIVKNLGLSLDDLNIYETTEPLAYYSHQKDTPQNILILENSDTFYSMRKYLLEGGEKILDTPISTLIYGGGKKIHKAFFDFSFCVEPYLREKENQILYFGDLDYEGIAIFEKLRELLEGQYELKPFAKAYEKMLQKMDFLTLPSTKEGQKSNPQREEKFYLFFSNKTVQEMKHILENRKYIPQEILNITDF